MILKKKHNLMFLFLKNCCELFGTMEEWMEGGRQAIKKLKTGNPDWRYPFLRECNRKLRPKRQPPLQGSLVLTAPMQAVTSVKGPILPAKSSLRRCCCKATALRKGQSPHRAALSSAFAPSPLDLSGGMRTGVLTTTLGPVWSSWPCLCWHTQEGNGMKNTNSLSSTTREK